MYSDLSEIALKLGSILKKIQEVPDLEPRENILLIGKALSHIFGLQHNLANIRPDLKTIHEKK